MILFFSALFHYLIIRINFSQLVQTAQPSFVYRQHMPASILQKQDKG